MLGKDLDYDLSHPCADCPFTSDGPETHLGVIMSLPQYIELAKYGGIAHSCHKTDNRPACDGPRNFKGARPKHCAGLLHMIANGAVPDQTAVNLAMADGRIDIKKLIAASNDSKAFKSVEELVKHYSAAIWGELLLIFDNPSVYIDDETFWCENPKPVRWLDAVTAGKSFLECWECGLPASHLDHCHPYHTGHETCEICHYGQEPLEGLIELIEEYAPDMPRRYPSYESIESKAGVPS